MKNEYLEQAQAFLIGTETTLEVIKAVPQKRPLWAKEGEKHGINYNVTLKNKNGVYTFDFWGSIADLEKLELAKEAKVRGIYSSHYFTIKQWCEEQASQTVPNVIKGQTRAMSTQKEIMGSAWLRNVVDTVEILIKPTAYDVLACLDVLHEDNFEDFCSAFGYENDSIKALKTFKAVKEQDHNLRRLFTHDQLERLSEIN